ncbi:hypothetical protein PENDEC_c109G01477, partial [Penicillium decumbens]
MSAGKDWLYDTGSDSHICADKTAFICYDEYTPTEKPFEWVTSGGTKAKAQGYGKVKLSMLTKAGAINDIIFDAVYYPGIRFSIFGAEKGRKDLGIAYNGIDNTLCDTTNGDQVIGKIDIKHNLPWIRHYGLNPVVAAAISPQLAHRRLGHAGTPKLRINEARLDDTVSHTDGDEFNCEPCRLGKSKKVISRTPQVRAEKAGQFIHADLQHMEPTGIGGRRYTLVITDDASQARFVIHLKTKDQASPEMTTFAKTVKNCTGQYPQEWRIDGGLEFMTFYKWAKAEGLSVQPSAAYAHEQNGISEMSGQMLMRTARVMMIDAGAPAYLWPEALQTAAYINNRLRKPGSDQSLLEKWRHDLGMRELPTTLSHLRAWYCAAYVNIPPEKRVKAMKMKPRAWAGYLVGYEGENGHLFRIYNPASRKILVTRDVSFWEGDTTCRPLCDHPLDAPVSEPVNDFTQVEQEDVILHPSGINEPPRRLLPESTSIQAPRAPEPTLIPAPTMVNLPLRPFHQQPINFAPPRPDTLELPTLRFQPQVQPQVQHQAQPQHQHHAQRNRTALPRPMARIEEMPEFRGAPSSSPDPITEPPAAPQPRRTVERPPKKRLHRTGGDTGESRPQQSQTISPDPTSGQSSEDYPIMGERTIVEETPGPPPMPEATPLPTPPPALPGAFPAPILQPSLRRTSRSTAGKPAERYDSEDYGKYGTRKPSASAAMNDRWEDDIGETGLCFASTELRIKAHTIPIPTSYKAAMASDYADEWYKAMETQIGKITDAQAYKVVDRPSNARILPGKWVYDVKGDIDGYLKEFRARWVVCGNRQRHGYDFDESYAPVATDRAVKLYLCMIAKWRLKVKQFDMIAAYLNAAIDDRVVYMKQPTGFGDQNKVWLLVQALYGLKQAAFLWYDCFTEALAGLGFKPLPDDICVYIKHDASSYIIIYVDDALVAARSNQEIDDVLASLADKFKMKVFAPEKFLGCGIKFDDGLVILDQRAYAEEFVESQGMTNASPAVIPMSKGYVGSLIKTGEPTDEPRDEVQSPATLTKFVELVGKAAWLASKTRPDMALAVAKLQQRTTKATKDDIAAGKHLVRYVKGTLNAHLVFGASGDGLIGYVDTSFADNPDRKSTLGWMFFFNGTPISWISKKQAVPAGSSTQAEYMAYEDAVREAIFLAKLARDMGLRPFTHDSDEPAKNPENAVPICTDSDNAIILAGQKGYRRAT